MTEDAQWPSSLQRAWENSQDGPATEVGQLVDGLIDIVGALYRRDADLESNARQYIARARAADRPGWTSAGRAVLALALWRAGEEDAGLLQLILAEIDLQDELRAPRADPEGGPIGAAAASNNLGVAYSLLRMFELAAPHLERAAAMSDATYGSALRLQVCVDYCNLAELNTRWAMHALAAGHENEALERAHAAQTDAQRFLIVAEEIEDADAMRYARGLAIGARSIEDPDSITAQDAAELQHTLALPLFGADPSEIVLRAVLARVSRIIGDADECAAQADKVRELAHVSDLASTMAAMREAALLDPLPNHSWELARTLAAETGAARHRQVASLRARLTLAGLEQRFEEVSDERQRLQLALQDALRQEAELVHAATHDVLTGLPNRALFEQQLQAAVEANPGVLVVAYADLDDFKMINDSYGHAAGDEVLRWLGQRLQGTVRDSDIVARLGGDEFGVILTSLRTPADAEIWANRMLGAVHAAQDRPYATTVSIGVCVSHGHDGPDEVLQRADAQMYVAKEAGKARASIVVLD